MWGEASRHILLKHLAIVIKYLRRRIQRLLTLGFRTSNLTCYEFGHTWTPYCRQAALDVFLSCLKYSLQVYSSVYVVTAIVKRKNLSYYLNVVWKDILRSTAFLTTNAFGFISLFCTWSRVIDGFNQTNSFIAALVSSLFSVGAIEQKSRHGTLAMYTTNLALEILYNMLTSRKLLPKVPYGEIILFSSALAGFLHLHRTMGSMDDFSQKAINAIFGTDEVIGDETPRVTPSPLVKVYAFLPQYLRSKLAQVMKSKYLTAKDRSCTHRFGCLLNISEKFVRCFAMGYGISTAVNIPMALKLLLRGKNPLVRWIFSKDNVSCGAFIAGMSSLHQIVSCLLRWGRGKTNRNIDGIISGAVAGLSMYFYRSSTVALYVLIRLVDLLVRKLAEEGKIPTIKNAYVYMYAISTALLFHAGLWEPHNIRPPYWNFMLRVTGGNFAFVNRRLMDKVFDIEASNLYPDFWPKYDNRFTDITAPDILKDVSRFIK